jgi:hypothetical protein
MSESDRSPQERDTNPLVVAFELGRIVNRLAFHFEHYRIFGGKDNLNELRQACGELMDRTLEVVEPKNLYSIINYISLLDELMICFDNPESLEELHFKENYLESFVARYENEGQGAIGMVQGYLEEVTSWISALHDELRQGLPGPLLRAFLLGETVDQGVRPRVTAARLRESADEEYRGEILGSIPRGPGDLPPDSGWWDDVRMQWNDLKVLGGPDDTVNRLAYSDSSAGRRAEVDRFCAGIMDRLDELAERCRSESLPGASTPSGSGEVAQAVDHAGHGRPQAFMEDDTRLKWGDFELDYTTRTVKFRGMQADIADPTAFNVFREIARARGELISGKKISESKDEGIRGRVNLIVNNRLPEPVHALIFSKPGPGGGYSLKLPS